MTLRNRIIAATMSVAIALPLMATTASTARPEGQANARPKTEQAATRHQEDVCAVPAACRGNDDCVAGMDSHHQERKDRKDD